MGVVSNIEDLAQVLSCRVEVVPVTYLGAILGTSSYNIAVWNPIVQRVGKWLIV